MNLANRWVFIAGLAANLVLVVWTLVAYGQEWNGAFWPLFIIWACLIALFVVVAFVSKPTPTSSIRSGGQSHE